MLLAHFTTAAELLRGVYRLHRRAKALRKAQTHAQMQKLIHEGRMRILRGRLVAKQRQYPQIEELDGKDIQCFSDEELQFYAALLLDKDEVPTPPYDSLEGRALPSALNWPRGPGAEERFNQAAEAWHRRNNRS